MPGRGGVRPPRHLAPHLEEDEMSTVRVKVPAVPDEADMYKSLRQVLTGLDDAQAGPAGVLGPEVGHGAVVETSPGALLLVVDEHVTGWAMPYDGGKRSPVMDAAVVLSVVQGDGELKPVWQRHFKTAKGAFGAAA